MLSHVAAIWRQIIKKTNNSTSLEVQVTICFVFIPLKCIEYLYWFHFFVIIFTNIDCVSQFFYGIKLRDELLKWAKRTTAHNSPYYTGSTIQDLKKTKRFLRAALVYQRCKMPPPPCPVISQEKLAFIVHFCGRINAWSLMSKHRTGFRGEHPELEHNKDFEKKTLSNWFIFVC